MEKCITLTLITAFLVWQSDADGISTPQPNDFYKEEVEGPLENIQNVSLNGRAKLSCAEGRPENLSPVWSRCDGRSLSISNADTLGGDLYIDSISGRDAGRYLCQLKNSKGDIVSTRETTLAVSDDFRPEIIMAPEDISATVGREARFVCRAIGNPKPTITWTGRGPLKNPDVGNDPQFQTLPNGDLLVSNTTMIGNDGNSFACKAENAVGQMSSHFAHLKVSWQRIEAKPEHQEVMEGSDVIINCTRTNTSVLSSILWRHDLENICNSTEKCVEDPKCGQQRQSQTSKGIRKRYYETKSCGPKCLRSSLIIKNAAMADSGLYSCFDRTSDSIRLTAYSNLVVKLDDRKNEDKSPTTTPVLPNDTILEQIEMLQEETNPNMNTLNDSQRQDFIPLLDKAKKLINMVQPDAPDILQISERSLKVFTNVLTNKDLWTPTDSVENRSLLFTEYFKRLESTTLELAGKVQPKGNVTTMFSPLKNSSHSEDDFLVFLGRSTSENRRGLITDTIYAHDENENTISVELTDEYEFSDSKERKINYAAVMTKSDLVNDKVANAVRRETDSGTDYKEINGKLISLAVSRMGFTNLGKKGVKVRVESVHDVQAIYTEKKYFRRRLHLNQGEKAKAVLGSTSCVFWNENDKIYERTLVYLERTFTVKSVNFFRIWDSKGCRKVESNQHKTVCECNHLTTFTNMVEKHEYSGKDLGLQILTWILCPLSIVCLFLTTTILSLEKKGRGDEKSITLQLCITLIMGNILLLVGEKDTFYFSPEIICTICGVLTHFMWLCVFGWMAVEGIYLYHQVVKVFPPKSDNLFTIYCLIGYGIPVIIVGLTIVHGYFSQTDIYVGEMFCWLTGNYIYWFMGPVILVILGNTCVLIMAVYIANNRHKRSQSRGGNKTEAESKWKLVKGTFSLTFLLGVSWMFGIITLVDFQGHIVFSYLFTIINASQGMFIFIFRCCLNDQTRLTMNKILMDINSSVSSSYGKASTTSHLSENSYLHNKENASTSSKSDNSRGDMNLN